MRMHQGYLTILKEEDALAIILTFPLSEPTIHSSKSIFLSTRKNPRKSFSQSMPPFTKIAPVVDDIEAQESLPSRVQIVHVETEAAPRIENEESVHLSTNYQFLVVDDSAMVRKMSMKLLRSLGHSCDEADDGDVAVSLVRSNGAYDVILMDNQMPRMTGEEATQIIRKELNFDGMIFGVTGNALAEDIQSFIDKGANEVIIKPLTAEILNKAIQKRVKPDVNSRHESPVDAIYKGDSI